MRVRTDNGGRLVVTHFEWSWLVVAVAIEVVALGLLLRQRPVAARPGGPIAVACFGLVFLASIDSSRFEFDPSRRVVTWERRAMLGRKGGSIAFDDITSIALGSIATVGANASSNARRLTLHTRAGVVPISSSTTAFRGPLRTAAAAIQAVLSAGRPASERPPVVE
jgi:hypothetical protein